MFIATDGLENRERGDEQPIHPLLVSTVMGDRVNGRLRCQAVVSSAAMPIRRFGL